MEGAPTARQIRSQRDRVARQFEQELIRLGVVVERRLSNYRYIVRDLIEHKVYRAIVLVTSFDYYEYRLNVGQKRIDMLIVQRHNAVVPVTVISLEQVMKVAPLDAPTLHREHALRRNHEEANLLLSKYILNFESAFEELAKMNPRTKQRYDRRRELYLKSKQGRPWAS
ncbi:hypothetical protein [Dictyobacter aurantiacus]|uniref:Uncharacterized protein n=1 Tax=Dictyobacter aurantiacus TaxID=1936993 RepID=A0A401ZBL0_9CHLR|nr:hypothetical protein [Dictyobacter aurantiacus]GCE04239.1 hypothetical protein KDAU_15680 [Dictyobacter aurantiacus]